MPLPITGFFALPYESPIFWSLPMVFLILSELLADFFGKTWTIKKRKIFFVLSLSLYVIGNAFWMFALASGVGLARGALLFGVSQEMAAIAMGILYFREKLSSTQWLGVVFGLIAITIMGGV